MRNMAWLQPFVTALCLVLLSSLLPPSTADTKTLVVTSDDRPLLSIHEFSFSGPGRVAVSVSGVSVSSRATAALDPTDLGFVLISKAELMLWSSRGRRNQYGHRKCLLHSPHGRNLFTFADLSPPPLAGFNLLHLVDIPREHYLLFVNCLSPNSRVSMTVRSEFYNLGPGGSRDYLSKGQEQLIPIFAYFSLAYLALLFIWFRLCNYEKRSVLWIHWMMFALLLIKGLDLIRAAAEKHLVRDFGSVPRGFDLISRTFNYYQFYTIEALIIIGLWKSKSVLHPKLRIVTLITVVVQIIANLGLFSLGDERGRTIHNLSSWNSLFVLTNLGCFLPVVVTACWSIRSLKEAVVANEKDAAGKLSEMMKLLGIYFAVIWYLHFIYLFLFPFKLAVNVSKGTGTAVEEGAHLALCATVLCVFRPEVKDGLDSRNVDDDVERQIEDEKDGTAAGSREI